MSVFKTGKSPLRYFLFGLLISLSLPAFMLFYCIFDVYQTGNAKPYDGQSDAAVVLGAAAWGNNPSPVFRERINHAIALYQSQRVGKLIFTGGTPKAGYMTEAEVGRRYALKQGIPKNDILFENTSRDTFQNLQNIRPLLRDNNIDSVIIVSDPYHLARARTMAADLGINATLSATPTSRYTDQQKRRRFLLQESYALFSYRWDYWSERILSALRLA
ncbi:MAG: YdcF family protein [Neisseria sp.]|uniref:YdcF family protein n=1 Tax=Neisseria sp. TaxID=192066 RepID=UPI0026DB66B6|nr:YdcF family protein [Neisseria sp.]MDO4641464.1 YdcF family protein [Neisseria sp.]